MTHIITGLCLRDNGCSEVCPVECINPGTPVEQWPTYYIDPSTCIDCGACIPECPFNAIFPEDEVPAAYQATGNEVINMPGLGDRYEGLSHHKERVVIETTKALNAGEIVDLRTNIQSNYDFYK